MASNLSERFPHILFAAYLALFVVLAIEPYDRGVWFAENLPIVLIVLTLVATYRMFRFSNTSYALMAVLIFLHTIGGHYTFERVPFGFVTELFGFARNHYDRLAHFSVGFYAYPIAELISRKDWSRSRWITYLFPVFAILSVAAAYEIIEWLFAAAVDPAAGVAFLGSQGDVWDAQKDMLADGLGAVAATILFALGKKNEKRKDVSAAPLRAGGVPARAPGRRARR